jgi:hypothetical protein
MNSPPRSGRGGSQTTTHDNGLLLASQWLPFAKGGLVPFRTFVVAYYCRTSRCCRFNPPVPVLRERKRRRIFFVFFVVRYMLACGACVRRYHALLTLTVFFLLLRRVFSFALRTLGSPACVIRIATAGRPLLLLLLLLLPLLCFALLLSDRGSLRG